MRLDNIKISKKLMLSFVAVTVLSIVCSGAAVYLYLKSSTLFPLAIVLIVAACFTSILVAKLTSARIRRPLAELTQAAEQMAQGNLNVDIQYQSKNETGKLAKAFSDTVSELKQNINEITEALGEMANGNFDIQISRDFQGDFAEIRTALENISSKLNTYMVQIDRSADQVTSGSVQVASAAQALAQGATEQASSIQELSASITEISEQVKQNAANAAEANRASTEAETKIQGVSHEMNQMLQAMSEISESSTKISNIIKTIDDIARQTNILALNAAVEAARAGAAGKGFAVVADEVRNLASKSADAAKDTTALIENSLLAVEKGKKITDATAATLNDVIQATLKSTNLITSISEASNAQATAISQVTLGVDQISAVVQTNSATAEQSAAASEEMSGHARNLKKLVGQFHVKADADDEIPESADTQPVLDMAAGQDFSLPKY
ncbi:methyl-accepting chemotaxis protein [Caproiciproducens sp. CPB-2]|uniref:methyl-accepting chemotaxis protein n=1 Tax=Caproiciproducens sp. CPB-2 TaxID=3030017 RepID=UPI0023DB1EF1|nr:methyl-accepting chemotaxis protein [Caproiciproducens sp. CPB-2]MDF1494268.1 methyl-accepting chemotaxis protein [Caproiciproducens sp. CPB-2]